MTTGSAKILTGAQIAAAHHCRREAADDLYAALERIRHEGRLCADAYGCANCNALSEVANIALSKASGD